MENIEIPRRSKICAKNSEEFTPGSLYVSLLEKTKSGAFERFDYCTNCWDETIEKENKIFWRSQVPPKKEKKQENLTLIAKAFSFLENFQKNPKVEDQIQAFFFAELLARYKHLKRCQEIEDDNMKSKLVYEDPTDGRVFMIEKVDVSALTKEEIEKIKMDDERASG